MLAHVLHAMTRTNPLYSTDDDTTMLFLILRSYMKLMLAVFPDHHDPTSRRMIAIVNSIRSYKLLLPQFPGLPFLPNQATNTRPFLRRCFCGLLGLVIFDCFSFGWFVEFCLLRWAFCRVRRFLVSFGRPSLVAL